MDDKKNIKVFQLNDYEWWAGESLELIVMCYRENVCSDEHSIEDGSEVSEDEMNQLIFNDEDGIKRTFREELDKMITEGQEFPCIFACTES